MKFSVSLIEGRGGGEFQKVVNPKVDSCIILLFCTLIILTHLFTTLTIVTKRSFINNIDSYQSVDIQRRLQILFSITLSYHVDKEVHSLP